MPTEEEMDEMDQQSLDFGSYVNKLALNFDELCLQRHEEGQDKYGVFTFLENDIPRMMLEELADTVNYCRYQAIKLLMLQEAMERHLAQTGLVEDGQEEITIGIQAFKGTKDVGWGGLRG